jgi:hypothetical protein
MQCFGCLGSWAIYSRERRFRLQRQKINDPSGFCSLASQSSNSVFRTRARGKNQENRYQKMSKDPSVLSHGTRDKRGFQDIILGPASVKSSRGGGAWEELLEMSSSQIRSVIAKFSSTSLVSLSMRKNASCVCSNQDRLPVPSP